MTMTNDLQVRKATRKKARLRLGISAPSGAGKTMGALLLAYGITGDWDKVGLIDTEEGSGELYVGVTKHGVTIGEFSYLRISKDFSPVNYTNAVHAMEKAGIEVIIVDSLTHAWSGTEGLLEKQGKIAARSGNSYTAWRDVTPQHNALVNCMLQSSSHIIATLRSKVEYALQDGDNGKKKVVKMGMAPIQREGMEYEFTTFFEIASDSVATTSKDRTDLFSTVNAAGTLEKRSFIITPGIGAELLSWLNTGKDVPPPEPEPVNPLVEKILVLLESTVLDLTNGQDKWIEDNRNNLAAVEDARLEKVYDYLNTKQPKGE
jgi:hypothetical protein